MSARHVMIRASAGSGKTYALTNRYVALLAAGARPERIVALTFTRKAAGEFFDEILTKLAGAAQDASVATRLARDIGRPELGPAAFLALLRGVVAALHRLRLGTFDGFFGRIARAFPLELGLAGEFEVLQEHAARQERRRVLQRMFARAPGGLDDAQREFVEAFKRATFGTEEKRLGARLDGFLDEHQERFLAVPDAELWGAPERIWPDGSPWLETPARPLADAAARLRARLAGRGLPEKQLARWEAFFAALPEWSPGAPLPEAVEYLLKNTLAVWPAVRAGAAEVVVERKKCALDPEDCAALAAIVGHLVGGEFRRRLETTRGIHAVLAGYEAVYHDAVRRAGKLTFADVQRLLEPETSGRRLAGGATAGEGRLLIDYRLDGQFDHWLLDEFQDTSHGQWRVLENLIDEAVQDPAGARSFFCVGDVKQAIYAWREGDARLFDDVLRRYNDAVPGTVAERALVDSWRSGPAVIGMVNAVFGAAEAVTALFPGPAAAQWNGGWRPHVSARPQLGGYAAWEHAEDEAARWARTVALLLEIAPLERGLDCAVLVQTNAAATALADFIRREGGIAALAESDLHVGTDNPLGAALLALVRVAAHPGDTLAGQHVAMSPLAAVLARAGLATPEALTRRVLGQIHAEGFERTIEHWVRALEGELAPDDAFSRERGRQLVEAAAAFDATGSREVAEFVAFAERHAVRGAEVAGVVRVMTIHKSKGLGFDVVILPDLEGSKLDQRRGGLAVQRSPDRTVEWVLELPPKLFYSQDETLGRHVAAAEAEAAYEALALLYVGLTRAKRAMYVLTKAPGKSESRNYPKLLATALGEEPWSAGDPRWFDSVPRSGADGNDAPSAANPAPADGGRRAEADFRAFETWRRPRRMAQRPSAVHAGLVAAKDLLDEAGEAGLVFGREVHGLLARIGREGEIPWAEWRESGASDAAVDLAARVRRAPSLAEVWAVPDGADLWCEREFELVLDGAWVSGVFDRVVVRRGAEGKAQGATIFDFKTDRVRDERDLGELTRRYSGQVALYRRAVARLTGLPESAVRGSLVFVGPAVIAPVSQT